MQIGVINRPRTDLLKEIAWISEDGFDFIDLTLGPPNAILEQLEIERVKTALAQHQLGVVGQAPRLVSLGSPYPRIRQATLEELRLCLDAARQLAAPTLSVHFKLLDTSFSVDEIVGWHVETLRPLCDEASDAGVTVLLENSSHGGHHQFNFMLSILTQVPQLGFHLSSGHARLEWNYDRFAEYLQRFGHRLMHVQLSDNDGTADQHLPLGCAPRSTVNWPQHIDQLRDSGYDGTVTLKVFSPEREYLLLSRTLLQRWWEG